MPPPAADNACWYEEATDSLAPALWRVFRSVREQNRWRYSADKLHAASYAGQPSAAGIDGYASGASGYSPSTLPDNVIRSQVNSLTAKVAKHRPLPQVLTQNGNWRNKRKAAKCTQALEGEFSRQQIFEKVGPVVVRDAGVFGRGFAKVYNQGRRIVVERVFPWQVMFDEQDARTGAPRNVYHVHDMDRGVVLRTFGRTAKGGKRQDVWDAVEKCDRNWDDESDFESAMNDTVDRIRVVEAWHLCDDIEAHEFNEDHVCSGRHTIAIETKVLLDEDWDHQYFPFAQLNYEEPITGVIGIGIAEQLEGYQYEINMTNIRLSEMFRRSGALITVPDGAQIHSQITNGIGTVLRHKAGGEPKVWPLDLVNPEFQSRIQILTQRAFQNTGLSQMSAQSEKPAGVTAGIALQTLDDIETERFILFGRAYATFCIDIAKRLIDCMRTVAEEYGDHTIKVKMNGGLLKLSWKDVDMDDFELETKATSLLPTELGGRLEKLTMLFQSQVITDPNVFLRLLDAPDLKSETNVMTSVQRYVDDAIEAMLDADEEEGWSAYKAPSSFIDFVWAAGRCTQRMGEAEIEGAPEFNIELLRQWIADCEVLEKRKNGEPTAAAAGAAAPQDPAALAGEPAPIPGATDASVLPPPPPPITVAA